MNHPHDATSAALIQAAHSILETAGPEALTVRRIASEAGMSTMNVYSRFDGKHGVIDELYADGFRRLASTLQAVPTTDDIVSDIRRVMDAYRRFAIDNPTYYRVMFRTAAVPAFVPSDDSLEIASTCLQSLTARVELGQARGDLATFPDWPALEISAWIWATCHGLVSLELSEVATRVSWENVFHHGARTAIRALLPSNAGVAA
jgi:AcrR family transcriptional regulator